MASRKRSFRDKRFRSLAAALAFYGVGLLTLDGEFTDKWVRGDCGGKERWEVKTLADEASHSMNLKQSYHTTLAELAAMDPGFRSGRGQVRSPFEKKLYTIECDITHVIKEDDEDLHLVLSDEGEEMVGEIVFPCCPDVEDAGRKELFETPFKQFHPYRARGEYKKYRWLVTGVAFVDFLHGQKGMLPTGVELHPILDIRRADL